MNVKPKASAVKSLSRLFAFLLVIVIIGIGALLFYAFQNLPTYAATVNQKLEQANLSPPSSSSSAEPSSLELKAEEFFATNDTYRDKVESDIKAYAQLTGVSVQRVTADSSSSDANKRTVSVQFSNPVPYRNLLQFIRALEGNVPHLTVRSLSLSNPNAPTSNTVTVQSLKINVAVR